MMNDSRMILVKAITLLYLESQQVSRTENSSAIVKKAIETIKLPDSSLSLDHERGLLVALKDTAIYMCEAELSHEHDKIDLLQRLQVACGNDDRLYESFCVAIDKDYSQDENKKTALSIRKFLQKNFRNNEIIDAAQKIAHTLRFKRDQIADVASYYNAEYSKIEKYLVRDDTADPAVIGALDLEDEDGLEKIYDTIQDTENSKLILRTGWQDLNNAMQGGGRRGESWVIPALQHKYKTGFSLSVFAEMCRLNVPVMKDDGKKPMMLRISFEDSLLNNFRFLFKYFWMCEHGVNPNLRDFTSKQMSCYVKEQLKKTGYHVQFMRVNPSNWTYKDIQDTIIKYESLGYEVHVLALDYLSMLPTTGCDDSNASMAVQDLYKRIRNFCGARDIFMFTPHQLSSDAKTLIREGCTDFVKTVEGKGYYQKCKSVDNEVDGELYIHIEKLNGRSYLTVLRGKHRGVDEIKDEMKYFVLPFPESGPIPCDIDKEKISTRRVGDVAGATQSNDEYDFAI